MTSDDLAWDKIGTINPSETKPRIDVDTGPTWTQKGFDQVIRNMEAQKISYARPLHYTQPVDTQTFTADKHTDLAVHPYTSRVMLGAWSPDRIHSLVTFCGPSTGGWAITLYEYHQESLRSARAVANALRGLAPYCLTSAGMSRAFIEFLEAKPEQEIIKNRKVQVGDIRCSVQAIGEQDSVLTLSNCAVSLEPLHLGECVVFPFMPLEG